MIIDDAINVYTDGSSFSHPRSGGIGIRLVTINLSGNEEVEDVSLPGYAGATNNQMELYACIHGIQKAMHHPAFNNCGLIAIHSDSLYVVENQSRALFMWSRNKWRNNQGKPVDNAQIWKDLLRAIKRCPKKVKFFWIKGHAKDQHNKAVDKLAKQSAKNAINRPLNVVKVRRKLSPKSAEPGCVLMQNQRTSIRIITDEYLRPQHCYKYKYEIISKSSLFYKNVDFAYSEVMLNAGHSYSIRFNDNHRNPTITKVFRELL